MANPSKAKGTGYENKLLERLVRIWPGCDRAKAGNESCDFHGTGTWVVEAKKRRRWDIPGWVRKVRRVAGSETPWVIFVEAGDLRTDGDLGEIAVMDADVALRLISLWEGS